MASVADCLVDILSRHEMLVIPDASEVVCRVFFLSLLLGNGGSQGINYYTYIHDLRIRHFVARYRELAAAHEPIVAQKLAQESGYHSYSTFSSAFKNRMGQSVTDWMREENLNTPSR